MNQENEKSTTPEMEEEMCIRDRYWGGHKAHRGYTYRHKHLRWNFKSVADPWWCPCSRNRTRTCGCLLYTSHINEALGIRTKKRHPLNECTSLDLPIGENERDGMTIADTVPDPSAEQAIEDAEQRAYIEKLHADLDLCLSMIPEECAEVVRGRYYDCLLYTSRCV